MGNAFVWSAIYPELLLLGLILALLGLEAAFWPRRPAHNAGYLAVLGGLAALSLALMEWQRGETIWAFHGMLVTDSYSTFADIVLLGNAVLCILLSLQQPPRLGWNKGEFYILLLLSTLGMMLMASAADLLVVFLGFILMLVPLYPLAASARDSVFASEAGIKFFVVGTLSGLLLLYGTGLVYGAAGTTQLQLIGNMLRDAQLQGNDLLLAGAVLVLLGVACQLALVPFHMWAPDVYQGSPLPVTAFLATGPKIAAMVVLMRTISMAFTALQEVWQPLVWVLALTTIIGGNLLALHQRSIKRMLAYVSIGHGGYALLGFAVVNPQGVTGTLFYLCAYALTSVGIFAVLNIYRREDEVTMEIRHYRGLATCHPVLALALAFLMLSLAGLPPTAGFVGKFYVLSAVLEGGYAGLALIAALSSLPAVYCCGKVVVAMYMQQADEDAPSALLAPEPLAVLLLAVLAVLLLGLAPDALLNVVRSTVIAVV
jgi:NADH-quinone oxidoreductase subunit N